MKFSLTAACESDMIEENIDLMNCFGMIFRFEISDSDCKNAITFAGSCKFKSGMLTMNWSVAISIHSLCSDTPKMTVRKTLRTIIDVNPVLALDPMAVRA